MDIEINDLLKQNVEMNLENAFILQNGPVSSPYDELMRSIIIAIYQHNIEEIVIITSQKENQQISWAELGGGFQEDFQDKAQVLNFLFENCKPEFFKSDLRDWLEGKETLTNEARTTVNMIRQHPLIPSDIKISEIAFLSESQNYQ